MRFAKETRNHRLRRRSRDQGRRDRRPQDARAHRRYGAVLRGRDGRGPSRAARDQEPIRQRRRDRRVPDDAARASFAVDNPSELFLGDRNRTASGKRGHCAARGHAAGAGRGPGARGQGGIRHAAARRDGLRQSAAGAPAGGARQARRACRSRRSTSFSTSWVASACRSRRGDLAVRAALASSVFDRPAPGRCGVHRRSRTGRRGPSRVADRTTARRSGQDGDDAVAYVAERACRRAGPRRCRSKESPTCTRLFARLFL